MERDAKRKATAPPVIEAETPRSAKRQKLPGAMSPGEETAESTRDTGLRFLESIRNARDKTGRPIATDFLTLPDTDTPGYYETIKLPIALDTMEVKLLNLEYSTMSLLESDCKRMVANAKQFNEKGSPIYEDAERVRKTASNFMTRHNPAYRNPNYVAVATPVPNEGAEITADAGTPYSTRHTIGGTERSRRSSQAVASTRQSISATPLEEAEDEEGPGRFRGKTFEQTQDMILEELMEYEEDGLRIFQPFVHLPSRGLVDYYQVIKRPVSLKSVQKLVRGIHGRNAPTMVSDFQSWDSFEQEVSNIWKNAQTYNEDGSEMFLLAGEFEDAFKEKFKEAKSVVDQPHQQTLKLKVGEPKSGIKIRLGGVKDSPGSTPGPSTPGVDRATPGVVVHNDALERQQQMVAAGVNGARQASINGSRNTFNGPGGSVPPLAQNPSRSASAASIPTQTNGVKNESAMQSPALNPAHPIQTSSVAGTALRPNSDSPHPQVQAPAVQFVPSAPIDGPPPGLVSSKFRPVDQEPSDYLLPSVHITSHPALGLSDPISIRVPASTSSLHQSVTFTVSASQYYLQITPNIPVALTNSPYRFFVMHNGTRLSEVIKPVPIAERDKSNPVFEVRLERGGVSKIEVEILAVKASAKTGKEEVQWEKTTCFVHVMRS